MGKPNKKVEATPEEYDPANPLHIMFAHFSAAQAKASFEATRIAVFSDLGAEDQVRATVAGTLTGLATGLMLMLRKADVKLVEQVILGFVKDGVGNAKLRAEEMFAQMSKLSEDDKRNIIVAAKELTNGR